MLRPLAPTEFDSVMISCRDISALITLWLDGELKGDERSIVESHLATCVKCQEFATSERRFLQNLRDPRNGHIASEDLRSRVKEIVESQTVEAEAPARLRRGVIRSLTSQGLMSSRPNLFGIPPLALVAAIVATTLIIGIWYASSRTGKGSESPSSFALMAADTHRRYLQNQLPLEIVSDAPDRISKWFNGKVPFGVELPDYQDESGHPKLYKLEGGRLVGYKNDYAAYVAYRMGQRPISLVVTSSSVAQPDGGEQIEARGLTFHFDSIYGYKVITWSDRGLTYALVSDLEERGQQSCGVCHQGAADQDLIRGLKPDSSDLKPSSPSVPSAPIF